ncbi:hypothetical protein BDV95DRAFT_480703 [Massariosphaeria phaeospora]|uniref:N-acetyltransferase domain-containing protein n=1 Tax=Massariosphaeria phaeospora TaxID=100035 RepID=A0A7C8IGZ1_9PLEO|nr:hypothetical protein BDV95DRAFT_480703 [Massariosphaeria phaeospora]
MDSVPLPATPYTVIRIPASSPRLADLAAKYRATKLAALQAEPNALAVKYADESLYPASVWQQRLVPPAAILICVALPDASAPYEPEDALMAGDWICMATIRGPLPYAEYHLPESGQPVPADASLETRWHLCNLYTTIAHRGKGLAKKAIHAALQYAAEQTRALAQQSGNAGKMRARIRLFCDPNNSLLVGMYGRLGFREAGMVTLKEAFGLNGDGEMIPADTDSTEELRWKWHRRYGLAMEIVVDA